MSCNDCKDTNPCEPKCNDCLPENPCYQTGCLNPTTWECITQPGNWSVVGIINSMSGKEVLQAIDDAFADVYLQLSEIQTPENGGTDGYTVKATANDTTEGFLDAKLMQGRHIKKDVIQAGGNEKIAFSVIPNTLVSQDDDNKLQLGQDGLLKVSMSSSEGKVYAPGAGIKFSESAGTSTDPIYVGLETSAINSQRTCFDGIWRNLTLNTPNNSDVSWVTGQPKYRIRYDGTIELKGSATYVVKFGAYPSSTREHSVMIASLPTTCISNMEIAGQSDLKSIHFIDPLQPSGDLIVQQYNYIIRKSNQNIHLELQSSFSAETTKTIVVSFDGAVWHPNI